MVPRRSRSSQLKFHPVSVASLAVSSRRISQTPAADDRLKTSISLSALRVPSVIRKTSTALLGSPVVPAGELHRTKAIYTMSRSSKMIPTKTAGSSPVHISSMAWNFKIFGAILLFVEMVLGVVSLWKAGYDLNTNFPEVIVMSSKEIMALVMRNIMAKSAGYDEEMVKLLEKDRDHSPVDQITGRVFVVSVSGIFILISFVLFALSLASLITRSFKRSAPVYEMICHLISFGAHLLAALALNMQIGIQGETFVNSEMMRKVVWIVIANSTLNFVSAIVSLLSCREFMITDRETTA
nr:uncharacterized protein LOC124212527 isoform X2 [Neodiprion pinetum]